MDSDSHERGNGRQIEQPRATTIAEGDAFLYALLNLHGADMEKVDAIFGQ